MSSIWSFQIFCSWFPASHVSLTTMRNVIDFHEIVSIETSGLCLVRKPVALQWSVFFFFFCFFGEHQGIFCNTIREPGTSWVNEQGGSLLVVLILRSILVSISHYKTVCLLLWFISVDISPWCKMEYSSVYVSGYLKMLEVHRSFSFSFFF